MIDVESKTLPVGATLTCDNASTCRPAGAWMWFCIACVLLSLVFGLAVGCGGPPDDSQPHAQRQTVNNSQENGVRLDIRDPDDFVRKYSQDSRSRSVLASFEDAVLTIESEKGRIVLWAELVSINSNRPLLTIFVSTQPCDFHEAVSVAMQLCELVGIPSTKIETWSEGKTSHPAEDPVCLQIGENEFGHHGIEIRPAGYATGPSSRVRYNLSWTPPEWRWLLPPRDERDVETGDVTRQPEDERCYWSF